MSTAADASSRPPRALGLDRVFRPAALDAVVVTREAGALLALGQDRPRLRDGIVAARGPFVGAELGALLDEARRRAVVPFVVARGEALPQEVAAVPGEGQQCES